VQLASLYLKDFRCFTEQFIELDKPVIVFEGLNGSGKTSLLEAIHYLCYLRSFRTYSPRELLRFGQESFFVRASLRTTHGNLSELHEIQAGFSGKRRLVKIDQRAISSYKELMDHYRVISLTEDDIALIKEGPEVRRTFIDQALMLADASFGTTLRTLRHVVENRNALLQQGSYTSAELAVWTQQLWEHSRIVQQQRMHFLQLLEAETNQLLSTFVDSTLRITFTYQAKADPLSDFDQFMVHTAHSLAHEGRYGRSLFGAHLDDFIITFQDKRSKTYSSRGQQKLLIVLVKLAQVKLLLAHKGPAIFLLDDFMTDFDEQRATQLSGALANLGSQLIFTSPTAGGLLSTMLAGVDFKRIVLTN